MKVKIYDTKGFFYGTIHCSSEDLTAQWWNNVMFSNRTVVYDKDESKTLYSVFVIPFDEDLVSGEGNAIRED